MRADLLSRHRAKIVMGGRMPKIRRVQVSRPNGPLEIVEYANPDPAPDS